MAASAEAPGLSRWPRAGVLRPSPCHPSGAAKTSGIHARNRNEYIYLSAANGVLHRYVPAGNLLKTHGQSLTPLGTPQLRTPCRPHCKRQRLPIKRHPHFSRQSGNLNEYIYHSGDCVFAKTASLPSLVAAPFWRTRNRQLTGVHSRTPITRELTATAPHNLWRSRRRRLWGRGGQFNGGQRGHAREPRG